MEKIIKKFETKFEGWLDGFEQSPVKTGIKALITFWFVKQAYKWIKNQIDES